MLELGTQTQNIVSDQNPEEGFSLLRSCGFTCADFSLNAYFTNHAIYRQEESFFFAQSLGALEAHFMPHRTGAAQCGVRIHQMHMPYPLWVSGGRDAHNHFLIREVIPKSLALAHFFSCPYVVVHGLKLAQRLGSEEEEWRRTEQLLHIMAPMAKEMGLVLCLENLYNSRGGYLVEGPCCDAEKMCARIDRLNDWYGQEIFGCCFDTGHANLVGLSMEDFPAQLGHRLKVLHIHDNDGRYDLHQIPFTFTRRRENQTSTDWDGFLRGIKKAGYQGVLSFETAPVLTAFPQELKGDALRLIGRIGAQFATQI